MKTNKFTYVAVVAFLSVLFGSCASMRSFHTTEKEEELRSAEERVAELEAENKKLKDQLEALNQSPEVMYRKAVSLKKDDPQQAMELLNKITAEYPMSEYSEPAADELAALVKTTEEELKRVLSEKELSPEATLQAIQTTLDSYGAYLGGEMISQAEQEIEDLQTEINRTRYIRSRYDDMQEVTFHSSRRDTATRTYRGTISIEFYLVESDKTDRTYFRFRADYRGESWIFYKKITLLGSNGVKIEIEPDEYREKDTEVVSGGVREWSDSYLSDSYNEKILQLVEAESMKVRFDGKYRIDFEMTEKQLSALREIVLQYEHLVKKGDE
jgi:hypothetical protein